ncbi:MAG: cobalamin-dependent protein [bacterium]
MSKFEAMGSSAGRVYKIAQVEELTGVGAHTLRAWERRYGVPDPERSEGGQRMYSAADVEVIKRMQELSEQGVPLLRAAELARIEPVAPSDQTFSESLVARIFSALVSWDEARAVGAWHEAFERFDVESALTRVVAPLLREVGTAWHEGAIGVAEEHFASNFVRARVDLLCRQVTPAEAAPSAVLACLQGEHHEIGLLMLSALLRFHGMRTIYLGQDVPDEELVRTVQRMQPQVVAVNAVTTSGALRLPHLVAEMNAVSPRTRIVFGGGAFDADLELRAVSGASYGGPDLSSAVLLISQLGRTARGGGKS